MIVYKSMKDLCIKVIIIKGVYHHIRTMKVMNTGVAKEIVNKPPKILSKEVRYCNIELGSC